MHSRRIFVPSVLFSLFIACSEAAGPRIDRVTPGELASALGGRVIVEGAGLDALAEARLVSGSVTVTLAIADRTSEAATLEVPKATLSGRYDLELVDASGGSARVPEGLKVVDGELRIEVVDIGQGDAAVITAPGGRTLVIDGGRALGPRDSIVPVLEARGLVPPDLVLVTHFDSDHLGGIVSLLAGPDGIPCNDDDRVPPLGLYDYAPTLNSCASKLCIDYYQLRTCHAGAISGGDGRRIPVPGEKIPLGGGVDVEVVAINGQVGDVTVPTGSDNSNAIALVVTFGTFRYFTAGDLTGGLPDGCNSSMDNADVETPVAERVGQVEALHVNHHGSCTSTNPDFLAGLSPQVSVISVGENNAYGHPSQDVVERVAQTSTRVFMTSPGMSTASERYPRTVLPAGVEPHHGSVRLRTRDGDRYSVDVLADRLTTTVTREFTSR
jgi:beta-lactamase superfamily II metal-dependent hydrolase